MEPSPGPKPIRAWAVSWFAYAAYYQGRKGFSVSKRALGAEVGLSEAQLGLIDTLYLGAYSLGQFGSGWLGDHVGARRLLAIGLFGSALSCAAFGASSAALWFGAFYFANGLFQATGWPGTTRAMAEWTTPRNRGTVMAFWSTCYQVGGIAANWIAGALLVRHGWRATFFGPALLLCLTAGTVLLWLAPGPGAAEEAAAEAGVSSADQRAQIRAAQLAVVKSPELWAYGVSYFFIKFIRYTLLFWLPYYLGTVHGYAGDVSANVASAFELGGIVGVIAIGTLSDRLKSISRAGLSALALLGLVFALFVYTPLSGHGLWLNALGLSAIGACLFGPDSLLSGAVAQDAGGRHATAAATGLVNGVGSIGGMLAGFVVPQISRLFGWEALFPSLVGMAALAPLALLPVLARPTGARR
jgi:OPA family sugar phosphate sensor protein UhpC-like MFS transporter